jgi:hypothetical protein
MAAKERKELKDKNLSASTGIFFEFFVLFRGRFSDSL